MKDPSGAPCPSSDCNSTDGFKQDKKTGWGHCFVCDINRPPEFTNEWMSNKLTDHITIEKINSELKTVGNISPPSDVARPFVSRGFSEEAVKRFKIDIAKDRNQGYVAKYPMFDPATGEHVANKVRLKVNRKDEGDGPPFRIEGDFSRAGLFGRHAFPAGSAKTITVVEGQDDAVAAFQLTGSKFPCVSVHSASSALKDVQKDFEYLNSFDNIVFAFDNDEEGNKAAKACAGAGFPLGKVKVLSLRKHKDANEYLKAKDFDSFNKEWWQAPSFKPDGLVFAKDMIEDILNRPSPFAVEYPWDGMNQMTYGARISEAILFMADTGVGKSSILREIAYKIMRDEKVKEKGYGIGMLFLEEPIADTALGLMSIHAGKPYHLPDTEKTAEELRKVHQEVLGDDRVILYDSFGSNDTKIILDKIRHMSAMGAKYIFLDHLSLLESETEGDERLMLDKFSKDLKTLTIELDICVICVIHTNRQGQARSSAGPEKVANTHIILEREKEDPDEWRRNVVKITIKKNRFSGRTGPACYLHFDATKNRMVELDYEGVQRYENGGTLREDEQW